VYHRFLRLLGGKVLKQKLTVGLAMASAMMKKKGGLLLGFWAGTG
jgi:hypothetical protein